MSNLSRQPSNSSSTSSSSSGPEASQPSTPRLPIWLLLAAVVVGVEALALFALGVVELAAFDSSRITMGLTTAAFFLVGGAGLGACAVGLLRARGWARGPVLVTQLIMLLLAWSFRGFSTAWVSLALAVLALLALVGLLHPRSRAAIDAYSDSKVIRS